MISAVWVKAVSESLQEPVRASSQAPLQTLMKLKAFYKGYFRQNKGYFVEILTKIKSKSLSNFRVISLDPDL